MQQKQNIEICGMLKRETTVIIYNFLFKIFVFMGTALFIRTFIRSHLPCPMCCIAGRALYKVSGLGKVSAGKERCPLSDLHSGAIWGHGNPDQCPH